MNTQEFFNLLQEEIKTDSELKKYYNLSDNQRLFEFRKAYFCQRMEYLINQISNPNAFIWDCGCGFGTISFFLAMNGIKSHGTTIGDHYFNGIKRRINFWNKYGDTSLFTYSYENLFDISPTPNTYNYIILQDTLHHLEPIQEVFDIFHKALKSEGKIILLEANGSNIIHRIKLYCQRGNKKIIEKYDEYLGKNLLYGNENYRSIEKWKKELQNGGFSIDQTQYIKFLLPFFYTGKNTDNLIKLEQKLSKDSPFLRKYFFFGLNFVAVKD